MICGIRGFTPTEIEQTYFTFDFPAYSLIRIVHDNMARLREEYGVRFHNPRMKNVRQAPYLLSANLSIFEGSVKLTNVGEIGVRS
jgi:hypothetical protein